MNRKRWPPWSMCTQNWSHESSKQISKSLLTETARISCVGTTQPQSGTRTGFREPPIKKGFHPDYLLHDVLSGHSLERIWYWITCLLYWRAWCKRITLETISIHQNMILNAPKPCSAVLWTEKWINRQKTWRSTSIHSSTIQLRFSARTSKMLPSDKKISSRGSCRRAFEKLFNRAPLSTVPVGWTSSDL